MKIKNIKIAILFSAVFLLLVIFLPSACNTKCRSLQSSYNGKVIGMYDFKDCFLYAQFDSILVITSDTAFTSYKKAHFKNCTATLDAVDFNTNCILGFKVRSIACNAAFHRNIEIDSVAKIYKYTVSVEKCAGCGTNITSTNIVVAPQIPTGYKLQFVTKTQ